MLELNAQKMSIIRANAYTALSKFNSHQKPDMDDLIQEGVLVFINCQKHFRADMATTFDTFFTKALRNKYAKMIHRSYDNVPVVCDISDIGTTKDCFKSPTSILEELTSIEASYLKLLLSFPISFRVCKNTTVNSRSILKIRKWVRDTLGLDRLQEKMLYKTVQAKIA